MIEIDRNKIYESHGYKFKNFVCLTLEEKQMILKWRNHEKVRNMMVHKEIIPLDNHLNFIESLKQRNDCYYWLVTDPRDIHVGILDIIHVDYNKNLGEIGFYLNPEEMGKGFEFMVEVDYFVFHQLRLKYNIVTVDMRNKEILLFNKYLGFSFEGIKEIDGIRFLYNNHATGEYIVSHYDSFNVVDYAHFIRKHKNDKKMYNII